MYQAVYHENKNVMLSCVNLQLIFTIHAIRFSVVLHILIIAHKNYVLRPPYIIITITIYTVSDRYFLTLHTVICVINR